MPDKELGERICAYVQTRPGRGELTFEAVIAFLKSKGASVLQLPERLVFVDKIPPTKVGKVDKKVLREDIKKRMGLAWGSAFAETHADKDTIDRCSAAG